MPLFNPDNGGGVEGVGCSSLNTGHSLASAKRLVLLDSRCVFVKILNIRQRRSTRMERPMHKAATLGTARLPTLPTTTESAKVL